MPYKLKLKRSDQKESVLYVEFMKNGTLFKFYTGKTIQCKNWNSKKQEVKPDEDNYKSINKYLQDWERELRRVIEDMEANQIRLTKSGIQSQLDQFLKKQASTDIGPGGVRDFISFIDSYIKEKSDKKPNLQRLNQCKKHIILANNLIHKKNLKEWNKLSNKKKNRADLKADILLPFDQINQDFIKKFRAYFLTATFTVKIDKKPVTRVYKINYRDKQIRTLKQFIIAAIESGLVKQFTWRSIKSEKKDVDSIYTDFAEIQQMYDEPLTKPTEKLVRDKYVLNCFLGMRYSDFNKLKPHFFQKRSIAGKNLTVYTGRNQKTDQRIEFALHPFAEKILEQYNFDMPKLSSKEYNKVLKMVAYKAGLTGLQRIREIRGSETIERDVPKYLLMGSHTGRRSFCTNFYNEGVSIGAIMSISGHQTEHEFRKYIKKQSVNINVVAEQVFAIQGLNTTTQGTLSENQLLVNDLP